MNKILVIGAGLSSTYLIDYLATQAKTYAWQLQVADQDLAKAQKKTAAHPQVEALQLQVQDKEHLYQLLKGTDLVVSLLPVDFQIAIAQYCLELGKHLFTASYIPEAVYDLGSQVQAKNLFFLYEMGLDPGLDHLSAAQILDRIRAEGGAIQAFRSFTGALISPESDNNPWHYKFTWNPANVVRAGQGGAACFLNQGKIKYIPYQQLFQRTIPVQVEGWGDFEAYANRDSLKYREIYRLEEVPTLIRGTLRRPGFCQAWNLLVQLGITDPQALFHTSGMTYQDWVLAFLPDTEKSIEEKVAELAGISPEDAAMQKLKWLGIFDKKTLPHHEAITSDRILQQVLAEKWELADEDRDMIVMQHQIEVNYPTHREYRTTDMVVLGEDATHTAIARTVGLPLAIAVKLFLKGEISLSGLHVPTRPEIYDPVLEELEENDIFFKEKVHQVPNP